MKLALAILVLVVFALSFFADYKWRKWLAQHRAGQEPTRPGDPGHTPHP
jgi:hypothetical protein